MKILKDMITEEDIKKLTIPQLIKTLSISAWILFGTFIICLFTVGFKIGYDKGIQSSNNRKDVSLYSLNGRQLLLLEEIWNYQKANGLNKVIIKKDGFIFDELRGKSTDINLSEKVLGTSSSPLHFEKLIISIPASLLKLIPEVRYNSPFVVSVTKEGKDIINRQD